MDARISLLRAVKKNSIVLLVLYQLDRPVGETEIAAVLDMNPETIRLHLRSLERLGMVARIHHFQGWILTACGRQVIRGESFARAPDDPSGEDGTSAENPRLIIDGQFIDKNDPPASAENPRMNAENPSSSAENPRFRPLAAASLSLSFKDSSYAAKPASAEKPRSNADFPRSGVKIPLSLARRNYRVRKKDDRTARGKARSGPWVQANLEAFASIGLAKNDYVSQICQMDHVTPDYILGQKKRLQAERRYSHGLLLTVIRSKDYLEEKYLTGEELEDRHWDQEGEVEEVPELILEYKSDPSIHEPMAGNGLTPAIAWGKAVDQLKRDMPKGAFENWVKDTVLVSAGDGTFLVGARSDHAREWLESRLSSTIRKLMAGICDREVEVRFVGLDNRRCTADDWNGGSNFLS